MRYSDGGGVGPRARARREQVRLQAAAMFAEGVDPGQVAAVLQVSNKSAYTWRRAWAAGGEQALASKGPSGPESGLSLKPARARTRAPRGHTPIVTVSGRRGRKLSIAGLACYREGHRPRLLYRILAHTGRKASRKALPRTTSPACWMPPTTNSADPSC